MLLNKYELEATNPNLTSEQRLEGYKKFQKQAEKTIKETTSSIQKANEELAIALAGKGIDVRDARQLKSMIFSYLDPSTKEYKELMKYIDLRDRSTGFFDENFAASRATKELWAKTQNDYMDNLSRLYESFGEGEELDKLLDIIDRVISYEDRLESAKRQIKDVGFTYEDTLSKGNSKEVRIQVKPVIPEGSIAELDAQISAKKTELSLAIDEESRNRLYNELQALTERKRIITFKMEHQKEPTLYSSDYQK